MSEKQQAQPDWQRLREWAADPRKKTPDLAFTAGPEREIADLIMLCHVATQQPDPPIGVRKGGSERMTH